MINVGTTRSHLDVSQFLELQKRILSVFPYISCHQKNFNAYSITLASIFLDAGSLFDSFAQTFIRCYCDSGLQFRDAIGVKDFAKKRNGADNFFKITDYRHLFETEFAFSSLKLNLNTYGDDFCSYPTACLHSVIHQFELSPFDEWSRQNSPTWWKAFTGIKHDRNANLHEATLKNAISATGAAFIVLTFFHESYLKQDCHGLEVLRLFTPLYWQLKGSRTQIQPNFI